MPIKYNDDGAIKRPDKKIPMSPEMMVEFLQAAKNIEYFAEKYFHIVAKKGKQLIKLRTYQKKMLKHFLKDRFTILNIGRQSGKCVDYDTYITIKNRITGEEKQITIGELFDELTK